MNNNHSVPVISVVGWANSGKTTVLEQLVTELKRRGYRVGIIKHHRGPFEIDRPGKDTWRLARAGAACTVISGPGKVGLVLETESDMRPGEIAATLMPGMDIIITEGYKGEHLPQIEVRRAGSGEERPASQAGQLVAVVGDRQYYSGIPCFSPDNIGAVADFIEASFIKSKA